MVGTDDDFGIIDVFAVGCREEAPVLTGFMLENGDGDEVLRVGIRVGFREGVLVGLRRRTPTKPK